MRRIPYVDLAAQHAGLEQELLEAVRAVLRHGDYILGPEVGELERRLASRLEVADVVGVNSGTDALILALGHAGVGAGDEVITVSHTFAATVSAIRLAGAEPVLVDVSDETLLLDPGCLEEALTDRTRAVLPVHLGGFSCDMTAIVSFCEEHGLALVEDCAQSLGARHRARFVGTFGIGAFSLHPLKVLSAVGDGGFVTLSVDGEPLRRDRNLGLKARGHVGKVGPNSRLDTLQAALLLVKLRYLDAWIEARRAHAEAYRSALRDALWVQDDDAEGYAVYSTFVIRHPERDALLQGLARRGIDAKVHYPLGVHQQQAFAGVRRLGLAVTERVVTEIVSLPVTPELDPEGREQVIEAVLDTCEELRRAGA